MSAVRRLLAKTPAGWLVVVGLLVPGVVAGCSSSDRQRQSMAWSHVEVSDDGHSAVVHAYQHGDPGCWDLVEVSASPFDGGVEVGVWYERTDQEFCMVPCPLQTIPHELEWDPQWDESRAVRPDGTPDHCSEFP